MVILRKAFTVMVAALLLVSMLTWVSSVQPFGISETINAQAGDSTDPSTARVKQEASILSEAPPTEWNKTYGGTSDDYAYSMVQTSDGGYAIAGYTYSFGASSGDFWLVKTDASGNEKWNKTYGGGSLEQAWALVQTADGGFALAGALGGGVKAWLVKTDASGNEEWNMTYGGTGYEEAYDLVQTGDGGYAIAGYTSSFGAHGHDFWLVKTDASGNEKWNKTYGGTGHDEGYALVRTGDGGYALAGRTYSYGAGGDFLLVKTDASGNIEWNKTYGRTGLDWAWDLVQTSDGGYALAGWTNSFGAHDRDFWLVKTDEYGNEQWNETYGGTGDEGYDSWYSLDLVRTGDGGYALAGRTNSFGTNGYDFWLVKTDANGNMQWNKTCGGPKDERATALVQTSDGGYALAGTKDSFGAGHVDFWLVKVAPESAYALPTPSLISPIDGSTLTSTSVTFSWSSSSGATDYQIEVNGPSSKLETVYSTSYTATLSLGSYNWRVRARNSYGWSEWASIWVFTVMRESKLDLINIIVLSDSYVGVVELLTFNMSKLTLTGAMLAIPHESETDLRYSGWLTDGDSEPLENREVKFLIDGQQVVSIRTTNAAPNVNGTVTVTLPSGIHKAELRFEGDSEFGSSEDEQIILAYKSAENDSLVPSAFSLTRDAYAFRNWEWTFDEYAGVANDLLEKGIIDLALLAPLINLFPAFSDGGHCFGMASSSSAYFLDSSLKPSVLDTYALSKDDMLWDINLYQILQLGPWVGQSENVTSAMHRVKSLIDSGTPAILGLEEAHHAIAVIGYAEYSGEACLITYDNNFPNRTILYEVKQERILFDDSTNVSKVVVVDPHDLPKLTHSVTEDLKEAIEEAYRRFFGLRFNSPVDINITSTSGKTLLIENNMVVRNDFEDSYVYLSETKIILLPSNENYTMEALGTAYGQVSLNCVFQSGGEIVIHQSPNVTINGGSRLYLPFLQSDTLFVDTNGDGTTDQTVPIPELPSASILSALMIFAVLVAVLSRKKGSEETRLR